MNSQATQYLAELVANSFAAETNSIYYYHRYTIIYLLEYLKSVLYGSMIGNGLYIHRSHNFDFVRVIKTSIIGSVDIVNIPNTVVYTVNIVKVYYIQFRRKVL